MECPFEKCFVISLARTPERLEKFRQGMPKLLKSWNPQVWPAVDGNKFSLPASWTAGKPLFGCYRSHMQILEHCIQNDIESFCVFEDDTVFRPDFDELFPQYAESIPWDWQQVYLGGQLLKTFDHPPKPFNNFWKVPKNVNRTNAMAVHSRGYADLYSHLMDLPFENRIAFDSHIGKLHETGKYRVYAPKEWLCGQRAGVSTITGNENSEQYWINASEMELAEKMRLEPPTLLENHDSLELNRRSEI